MKNNLKFFSIVLVVLLASFIVLTGCMYAIAANKGDAKVYNMGSQIRNRDAKSYNMGSQIRIDSNIIVDDDAPISQTELQKKFSAMYDICEDEKTITVISKEYLSEYWHSNYEKEVIHSLTTEEVYFIIQDSIRIYMEHDKVILAEFASMSSNKQVAERFPFVEEQEVCRPVTSHFDRDKIETDIHKIVMYRLRALSSPKAFFTGADAIRFVGGDALAFDGKYPESVFYIPSYSANTDRDYILSVMGGNRNFTDLEKITDLFEVSVEGGISIRFSSITNGTTTDVFPSEDIYRVHVPDGLETSKDNNVINNPDTDNNNPSVENNTLYYFKLDTLNKKCSLMAYNGKTEAEGIYTNEGDAHILTFDGDFQYVLYCNGNEYVYAKGESNPIPEYEIEDKQSFVLDGDALISEEG